MEETVGFIPEKIEDSGKHQDKELEQASVVNSEEETNKPSKRDFFMQIINKKTNIYSINSIALKSPWTFWIDRTHNGMRVKEFEENLHIIYTVYSVNEFWRVLCNIPYPCQLDNHTSLHFTQEINRPVWESPHNCRGGTFRLRVAKKDTNKVWRELLLATAAGQWDDFVDEEDDICGISVSVREKYDVVLIWNKEASLSQASKVFELVRVLLPDTLFSSQFYKPHYSHRAFEKSIAVAGTSSDEGPLGGGGYHNLRRDNGGGGDNGKYGHGHGHGGHRGHGGGGSSYASAAN